MDVTGVVSVSSGESQILSTLIEKKGSGDPVRAATEFLASCGIGDQDCANLTGSYGTDGSTRVFFVTAAVKAAMAACQGAASFLEAAKRPKATLKSKRSKAKAAPKAKKKTTPVKRGTPDKRR